MKITSVSKSAIKNNTVTEVEINGSGFQSQSTTNADLKVKLVRRAGAGWKATPPATEPPTNLYPVISPNADVNVDSDTLITCNIEPINRATGLKWDVEFWFENKTTGEGMNSAVLREGIEITP